MSNKHRIGRISLLIIILVVVTLSGATANNISLTEKEIEILAGDTMGLLNGGIRVAPIIRSEHPDGVAVVKTDVAFFNTQNESVTLDVLKQPFWEEREHTVKENYTFYLMPNLNWVETQDQITINPMSKYIMPVTIKMPVEEGFDLAEGGGFICMIGVSRVGYEEAYAHKLFLILEEGIDTTSGGSFDLGFNPVYLLSLVVVGGVILAVVLYKRRTSAYEYDDYDDNEEYEPY